ncbi:Fic family protein [Actinomycetota bacterium]
MAENKNKRKKYRPAGYYRLIKQCKFDVIPHWHKSMVSTSGIHKINTNVKVVEEVYPPKYWPGDSLGEHLEFALKYDGVNLAILMRIFEKINKEELVEYIKSKYTGKYARRLWFLFEFLTGKILPLDDLKQGNYIYLLEPEKYYTNSNTLQVKRQRIYDNLLGNRHFCPVVRRTDKLQKLEKADLPGHCSRIFSSYSPELLKRALGYLYTKETRSSFEIEHIEPSLTRIDRFVALLQSAGKEDFFKKEKLIELQNNIVDSRFQDTEYRSDQNYVGETVAWKKERIHFISPKPEDLPGLIDGLISSHKRMRLSDLSAVIHAATISYGFVFMHPFEDGNGRIHRFLIHNILALRGFTPNGVIFPVSAVMLKNPTDYDTSLEAFSNRLMPLVEYSIDEEGHLTVHNDTAIWYRYIDMTSQAEALFHIIEKTIDEELKNELEFLANYDKTKKAIQEIVDMPDNKIDLFIRFCLQNRGRLSKKKYMSSFDFLTEEEVLLLEEAIQTNYNLLEFPSGSP